MTVNITKNINRRKENISSRCQLQHGEADWRVETAGGYDGGRAESGGRGMKSPGQGGD